MKKAILFLFLVILFNSCKKEEDITTYQVSNELILVPSNLIDGILRQVVVYYYDKDLVVDEMSLGELSPGEISEKVKFNPEYKLRVSFTRMNPDHSMYQLHSPDDARYYIRDISSFKVGENNILPVKETDTFIMF